MADKKTAKKSESSKPEPKKPEAKKPEAPKAEAKKPEAPKAAAKKAEVTGWGRQPKGGPDNACSVEGCKRPYRAKGYCYFHFKKWRQGELPHSRYRTCSKAECRAKAVRHGLCEKHEAEVYGKAAAEPAA